MIFFESSRFIVQSCGSQEVGTKSSMFNKLLDFFCYHKIKNIYEGKMKMDKNRKI